MIRELKARKAKFGFDLGQIHLGKIIALARFLEALQEEFTKDKYIAEEVGNQPELRLYTDDETVAQWIRSYKF